MCDGHGAIAHSVQLVQSCERVNGSKVIIMVAKGYYWGSWHTSALVTMCACVCVCVRVLRARCRGAEHSPRLGLY